MMRHRKSPRASWIDYTMEAAYFVTICCKDRISYFGEVVDGEMRCNVLGEYTRMCRDQIQTYHPHVRVDVFVCMPNHIHGILFVGDNLGGCNPPLHSSGGVGTDHICPNSSLSSMIRGFKTWITKYAKLYSLPFHRQRSFHDHVIRKETEYNHIAHYIRTNPTRRNTDCFYQW
jgi:putative transposase